MVSNVRLFAIEGNIPEDNESTNYLSSLITAAISEADERDKTHQKTLNEVRDSQSLVTKTPWLRRTHWVKIFVGKDMATLVKLTNAPGIHDHQERSVWQATAGLIERCFKGILDCQERGWTLIPFWLRSVDRNKEDTKPFRTFIAPYTLRRYAGYWQQYILFCLRAVMTEDAVQFTVRQRDALYVRVRASFVCIKGPRPGELAALSAGISPSGAR